MNSRNSFIPFIYFFFVAGMLTTANLHGQHKQKDAHPAIANFDKEGRQMIRYSNVGDALDAHDGEIAFFDGNYYLYGTSYDCGFEWQNKHAAFCGFKVYVSKDMEHWTDMGFLFDGQTKVWQTRCNGNTYGCFRPHVIYNRKTKKYVLWINVYDNISGYRVFTSKTPVGPFEEVAEPTLTVNATAPSGGLNNGDHDTFVDDDGNAYIAYTDWRRKGSIVIEKLSADYLSGAGEGFSTVTEQGTEAPGMFKRNGIYYVVYSDPNCGYCSGTGASYKMAKSPLGPWSESKKISDNSCGGQPSFVSTIKLNSNQIYLFGSDLWNDAARNEALANYYWSPLIFNTDGTILPLDCSQHFTVTGKKIVKTSPAPTQSGSYKGPSDLCLGTRLIQTFAAPQTGLLNTIYLPLYKKGNPDFDLKIEIYATDEQNKPTGEALFNKTISPKSIGWAIKRQILSPKIYISKGTGYCIMLSSETTTGSFGYTYDRQPVAIHGAYLSKVQGDTVKTESEKKVYFNLNIASNK